MMTTRPQQPPPTPRFELRAIKRPLILTGICFAVLIAQHVLLRAMAHGHVAHALLAAGNAPPDSGAVALAIALVVVRFLYVIIVPGLGLAAAAELVAYLLVGPKRAPVEDEEEEDEDENDGNADATAEAEPRSQSH